MEPFAKSQSFETSVCCVMVSVTAAVFRYFPGKEQNTVLIAQVLSTEKSFQASSILSD